MTDKQIMINGVDVSGCERHCSDNRNNPNMCYSEMTRTYSNCNPKEKQCYFYITSIEQQLKAKEQECERLKETLEEIRRIANSGSKCCDRALRNFSEVIFATVSEVLDG